MDSHQQLITLDDLRSEVMGALDAGDYPRAAVKAIQYATREIERYLERDLIVREQLDLGRQLHLQYDYDVSTDSTSFFSAYVGDWPVLEVVSVEPSDYTIQIHPDARRVYTELDSFDYTIRRLRYFAGYRREDQTLATLQGKSGLSGLTTEPPALPEDIRSVCLRLAVHRLQAMKGDGLGLGQRNLNVGGGQIVTGASVDPTWVNGELETLNQYRSVAW